MKATATDNLRLLVHEETLRDPTRRATDEALDRIGLKPREAFISAAAQRVRVCRATFSEIYGPHTYLGIREFFALRPGVCDEGSVEVQSHGHPRSYRLAGCMGTTQQVPPDVANAKCQSGSTCHS